MAMGVPKPKFKEEWRKVMNNAWKSIYMPTYGILNVFFFFS